VIEPAVVYLNKNKAHSPVGQVSPRSRGGAATPTAGDGELDSATA